MLVKAIFGLILLVVPMISHACAQDQVKVNEAMTPMTLAASPSPTPLASAASPLPTPCAFFADMYPVSEESFVAHHASAEERNMILHWSATVANKDRHLLRWMHIYDGIVFVAPTIYFTSHSYPYKPWWVLNANLIVDPVQCEILARPTA